MVALEKIYAAQSRAASHYMDRLRQINYAYVSGGENIAFAMRRLDSEWEQICRWQTWLAQTRRQDAELTQICSAFPIVGKDILGVRLGIKDGIAWFTESLEASFDSGQVTMIVANLLSVSEMYITSGNSQTAIDYAQRVFEFYPEKSQKLEVGKSYALIATAESGRGDLQKARDYYQKALSIFQQHHEIQSIANTQYWLSTIAGRSGNYEAVTQYIELALPIFEQYGDVKQIANCYNNLGLVALRKGKLEQAADYLRRSIQLFEVINFHTGLAKALANLSTVLSMLLKYEEAEDVAQKSLEHAQRVGNERAIVDALLRFARIYIPQEKYAHAERTLLDALKISDAMDHPYALSVCLQMLGISASRQGRFEQAEHYLQRGLKIAEISEDQHTTLQYKLALFESYLSQQAFQKAKEILLSALIAQKTLDEIAPWHILRNALDLFCVLEQPEILTHLYGLFKTQSMLPEENAYLDKTQEAILTMVNEQQFNQWYQEGVAMTLEEGLFKLQNKLEDEFG